MYNKIRGVWKLKTKQIKKIYIIHHSIYNPPFKIYEHKDNLI